MYKVVVTKLSSFSRRIIPIWEVALNNKIFRLKLALTPGLFFIYSAITQRLGDYIEIRKGARPEDMLLTLFPNFDFSTEVFLLLYLRLFSAIVSKSISPLF